MASLPADLQQMMDKQLPLAQHYVFQLGKALNLRYNHQATILLTRITENMFILLLEVHLTDTMGLTSE